MVGGDEKEQKSDCENGVSIRESRLLRLAPWPALVLDFVKPYSTRSALYPRVFDETRCDGGGFESLENIDGDSPRLS